MNAFVVTVVRVLQLCAVMMVCFNHWSITLLKWSPPFFSEAAYREPGMFGLIFLFLSSGFLSQYCFSGNQAANGERGFRLDFVVGRYWRLLLPVLAAIAFDYWIQGFAEQRQTADMPRALPFLLTLTQTWHYSILGATSLAAPTGGSNMAWLGANLFFLTIFFGVTARFWSRLRSALAISMMLAGCAVLLAVYFRGLDYFAPEINHWAAQRYGQDLHVNYSLFVWLFEYCPYIYLPVFCAGLLVARLIQVTDSRLQGRVVVAALLVGALAPGHATYLGWSVALLILATRGISVFFEAHSRCRQLFKSGGLLDRLGSCAYEVYVIHLVIYLAFTLSIAPAMSAYGICMLAGWVVVVNGLMLLLCLGLGELYFRNWHARVTSMLGFTCVEDLRYV